MKEVIYNFYESIVNRLLSLNRNSKNIIIILTDYLILVLSFWLSLSVRINEIYNLNSQSSTLIFLTPLIAIPIFYFFGFYESIVRYANFKNLLRLMLAVTIYSIIWFFIVLFSGVINKPYDFLIINWLITTYFIAGTRYIARWLLLLKKKSLSKVIIYGTGDAAREIESAMKQSNEVQVAAFVDDNKEIIGRSIEGIKIISREDLEEFINKNSISEILIAMPSLSKNEINSILQDLKKYPVIIRTLPALTDIAKGRISIRDLRRINIDDLLRRETRKPERQLLKKDIEEKNILVAGAAGSIGSELCRQIIRQKPKSLILFDISESSLYLIERELIEMKLDIPILPILGNITNTSRLKNILNEHEIDTIYHAAAYKHVPMVEKNAVAGIRCNIFGTLALIEAAIEKQVISFVFISTDKAVRPTNIMGATKRFAEIILQSKAKNILESNKKTDTRISIVRFGNVLGSSGSVVPLFQDQIEKGGPLTVTDPDIIRYFMTITEASQLVIQSGSMGSKAEIFVLDMGDQVKVLDLAKDMIRLAGKTIKDDNNPDGDIEIIFTGLRPGEKLYEELLIEGNIHKTKHERIMIADDKSLEWEEVESYLLKLENAINQSNLSMINDIFKKTVTGYKSELKDKII